MEQLTTVELKELRQKLVAMPRYELENFYKATHNACRLSVRVPPPRMDSGVGASVEGLEEAVDCNICPYKNSLTCSVFRTNLLNPRAKTYITEARYPT
jgi:hypothetical protein